MKRTRIAILASGNGTNAEQIMKHFEDHATISVHCVLCNKPNAGVIARSVMYGIPVRIISKQSVAEPSMDLRWLLDQKIDLLVLAGFLWLIPEEWILSFDGCIINIHPALLPKYGGKGMYGHHVHEAVIAGGEKESGITIHLVNQEYDRGKILFQARCPVKKGDDPDDLSERIHKLEHQYFPAVIEEFVNNR
ncbi:MAG: phosphoribosylglycinamide formyltransferase [Flavobacteriales bacterium]